MPSARPNTNAGRRPKGAKPESWQTIEPAPTPQPAQKIPSDRPAPLTEAAKEAREAAEKYAEKMNRRRKR
jgi:hypothetical protein